MKTILTIVLSFVLFSGISQEVIKATSQSWAGGVCCRTGVNYHVTIKTDIPASDLSVKKIWLEGATQPISGNVTQGPKGQVYITFGIQSDITGHYIEIKDPDMKEIECEGAASITLLYGKKEIKVIVKNFETLMMIAYP